MFGQRSGGKVWHSCYCCFEVLMSAGKPEKRHTKLRRVIFLSFSRRGMGERPGGDVILALRSIYLREILNKKGHRVESMS